MSNQLICNQANYQCPRCWHREPHDHTDECNEECEHIGKDSACVSADRAFDYKAAWRAFCDGVFDADPFDMEMERKIEAWKAEHSHVVYDYRALCLAAGIVVEDDDAE